MFFHLLGLLLFIPLVWVGAAVYREQLSVNYLIGLLLGVGLYFVVVGQIAEVPFKASEMYPPKSMEKRERAPVEAQTPIQKSAPVVEKAPVAAVEAPAPKPTPKVVKGIPAVWSVREKSEPAAVVPPAAVTSQPVPAVPVEEKAVVPAEAAAPEKIENTIPSDDQSPDWKDKILGLAKQSVDDGSRKAYEELISIAEASDGKNAPAAVEAAAELEKIKSFYRTAEIGKDANLDFKDADGHVLRNEQISTGDLIYVLNHGEWQLRVLAARLLRVRREKNVPDALIGVIASDSRLDVVRQAVMSFADLTGYRTSNPLPVESVQIWWEEHRQDVLKSLPA